MYKVPFIHIASPYLIIHLPLVFLNRLFYLSFTIGIPKGTLGTWLRRSKKGEIDTGTGTRTVEESLNLAEQLQAANKRIKELEKKNRELEELNEFLEEASAFFAASRRKSGKKNG